MEMIVMLQVSLHNLRTCVLWNHQFATYPSLNADLVQRLSYGPSSLIAVDNEILGGDPCIGIGKRLRVFFHPAATTISLACPPSDPMVSFVQWENRIALSANSAPAVSLSRIPLPAAEGSFSFVDSMSGVLLSFASSKGGGLATFAKLLLAKREGSNCSSAPFDLHPVMRRQFSIADCALCGDVARSTLLVCSVEHRLCLTCALLCLRNEIGNAAAQPGCVITCPFCKATGVHPEVGSLTGWFLPEAMERIAEWSTVAPLEELQPDPSLPAESPLNAVERRVYLERLVEAVCINGGDIGDRLRIAWCPSNDCKGVFLHERRTPKPAPSAIESLEFVGEADTDLSFSAKRGVGASARRVPSCDAVTSAAAALSVNTVLLPWPTTCPYCNLEICDTCLEPWVSRFSPLAGAQADARALATISHSGQSCASFSRCLATGATYEEKEGGASRSAALGSKQLTTSERFEAGLRLLAASGVKRCPNCGAPGVHALGHACHHISPSTGCPQCHHHYCFTCLGPHPCPNKCDLFCHVSGGACTCDCEPCPACRPGAACPECTNPSDCPSCS